MLCYIVNYAPTDYCHCAHAITSQLTVFLIIRLGFSDGD